jgi:hypothetical protein
LAFSPFFVILEQMCQVDGRQVASSKRKHESSDTCVGNCDRNDSATVKENNGTIVMTTAFEKNGVTWADIVRNGRQGKGKNQSVVSSSFSRNNPGSTV